MSIIVIGARGYIGKCLLDACPDDSWGTSSTSGNGKIVNFDLSKPGDFPWQRINIGDVVILTAAISSPDICAHDTKKAWLLNVTGTTTFISEVISRGVRVVFFSSDTVYGERANEFDEATICSPSGEYAMMKFEVESRFLRNPFFKTLRLSYVFSREDKFTKYLLKCAENEEEAEIFHPFYRAVVHRDDVVQGAITLAKRWEEFPQSVINFGGPDIISRIEFAQVLKESVLKGLSFRQIEPEEEFFANRPRIIKMKSQTMELLLGRPALSLREAVDFEFFDDKGEKSND